MHLFIGPGAPSSQERAWTEVRFPFQPKFFSPWTSCAFRGPFPLSPPPRTARLFFFFPGELGVSGIRSAGSRPWSPLTSDNLSFCARVVFILGFFQKSFFVFSRVCPLDPFWLSAEVLNWCPPGCAPPFRIPSSRRSRSPPLTDCPDQRKPLFTPPFFVALDRVLF